MVELWPLLLSSQDPILCEVDASLHYMLVSKELPIFDRFHIAHQLWYKIQPFVYKKATLLEVAGSVVS